MIVSQLLEAVHRKKLNAGAEQSSRHNFNQSLAEFYRFFHFWILPRRYNCTKSQGYGLRLNLLVFGLNKVYEKAKTIYVRQDYSYLKRSLGDIFNFFGDQMIILHVRSTLTYNYP